MMLLLLHHCSSSYSTRLGVQGAAFFHTRVATTTAGRSFITTRQTFHANAPAAAAPAAATAVGISRLSFLLFSSSSSKRGRRRRRKAGVLSANKQQEEYLDDYYGDYQSASGYDRPKVQWYPGHIAKAERQLQETVKAVDVVVEVRDARLPAATAHPMVNTWCAGKPRLIVYTHADAVPHSSIASWKRALMELGADHPDSKVDKQIQNQAIQAHAERSKYTTKTAGRNRNGRNNNRKKSSFQNNSNVVAPVQDIVFVNAQEGGMGIRHLIKSVFQAGQYVQERRLRRGLMGRPLRVGVLGYPNVGKSAVINRLVGRKRAKTANTPGVTRSLQWIRISSVATPTSSSGKKTTNHKENKEFELLDSPGIIPNALENQSDAMLLAACNCIGDNAYDNQSVAAYLCQWLLAAYRLGYQNVMAPKWRDQVKNRYKFDPLEPYQVDVQDDGVTPIFSERTGEDILYQVADNMCLGDPEDAARKILQDFRNVRMGPACLQVAPKSLDDRGQVNVLDASKSGGGDDKQKQAALLEQQARAQQALVVAKERGLELPPAVAKKEDASVSSSSTPPQDVGKGLFDGW